MESFNFLKFWRTTAAVRDIDSDFDSVKKFANDVHYVRNPTPESTDEDSFFDLVFTENNIPKPESPKHVLVKPMDANSKPHSPNSVLNTSPKFRVCFLGFRKSKPEKLDLIDDSSTITPKIATQKAHESKMEEVPISCISFSSLKGTKLQKVDDADDSSKQFARANMAKYLKLMKPLYSKASKRFTQKSQLCSLSVQSPRNSSDRVAVLAAVRKRLGKSRSIAGVSPSPMNRRDDSLLQEQNDGIQGAILHCKRSYSSARKDCSVLLSRNANEDLPRASCHEEQNRWSI